MTQGSLTCCCIVAYCYIDTVLLPTAVLLPAAVCRMVCHRGVEVLAAGLYYCCSGFVALLLNCCSVFFSFLSLVALGWFLTNLRLSASK